jgi:putative membrane protein
VTARVGGWLLYYLPVMTILGLSGLWEIIESWVARIARPELGLTVLGAQGDIWDAQKDMTAAMYGSILCVGLIFLARKLAERTSMVVADSEPLEESS